MFKNGLFNLFVAIALAIVIVLTVQEVAATTSTISETDSRKGANALECSSLPSRYSIHTEALDATGTRFTYTEDGATGVDGGLIYLLSNYRTCSR